jgi:hypothetical protein
VSASSRSDLNFGLAPLFATGARGLPRPGVMSGPTNAAADRGGRQPQSTFPGGELVEWPSTTEEGR